MQIGPKGERNVPVPDFTVVKWQDSDPPKGEYILIRYWDEGFPVSTIAYACEGGTLRDYYRPDRIID